MHPDDMKEAGVRRAATFACGPITARSIVQCDEGKVPAGMIFVPYGPPTCQLMGQTTDGTGNADVQGLGSRS